ncbi:MAG: bifunctional precorrin-2 dehydrogenase/sirohydrochlorin ferrochelatase [Ferruginibacter sp.]
MSEKINTSQQQRNRLFPVFLKLEHLHVLLVGAGKIGLEKLSALLHNNPDTRITLVAMHISDEVKQLAAGHPSVLLLEKEYEHSDLVQADIAIIAANDKVLSSRIVAAAHERGILVNVADTPDLCDFYLGSIVQKGNLKIGISTGGKSPTMAKRMRELLSDILPDELDELIENVHAVRNTLQGDLEQKVKKLNELTRLLVEESSHTIKQEP